MENQPGESVAVRVPFGEVSSYSFNQTIVRSAATASIRQLWSTVTYPVRQLWSTVIYPFGQLCWELISLSSGEIYDYNPYIVDNPFFSGPRRTHYILLLWTLYIILLPITLTWKLLTRKPILTGYQIFAISCIAVSLDPFFFYIPIINQENKCLGVDKKLRNTLLVLRSVTDFASVLHIVSQVRDWTIDQHPDSHTDTDSYFDPELRPTSSLLQKLIKSIVEAINGRMPWLSVSLVIDFLALLPIPQVAIVVVFFRMGGSKFFLKRTILNVFLIFQYVPRVCQIYLSSRKLERIGIWVRGAFNFFLYILAGHVLASFWYFFSIQREISCWHQTCRNVIGCTSTYECGDSSSKNISLLNELCPISSPNAAVFDFGIYLDILQSGNTGSIDFSKKFFYSLWWGIRNLSNFGTNLETSSYVWENCFAILIGLIGLLLFLYLIGNVQTYIQLATTKSVKIEEKAEELRRSRINKKYREMKMWMSSNGLPEDLKTTIREYIKKSNLAEKYIDAPVDLKFLRSVLPYDVKESMLDRLKVKALKKVPMFESVDERDLKDDCKCLDLYPSIYPENSYIFRAGERCDRVIFIIEGVIELTDTTSNGAETMGSSSMIMTERLEKGQYYGEELLNWASLNYELDYEDCSDTSPISTRDVKCRTKVEALCIDADDLLDFLVVVSGHCYWRQNKWVKRTLPHENTDETLKKTNLQSATTELEEIKESKKMKMKNKELHKGSGEPREDVAVTGASTSTTVEQRLERIIQLQGDMLREQLVLARQNRDDIATLGRKLDDMAVILATL
ncbi:cyclic nucleotide-gated ion channel 1-like [Rosa sericea]